MAGVSATEFANMSEANSPALAQMVDGWVAPAATKSTDDPGVALYQKTCQSVVRVGTRSSLGSGSIIDRAGLVITNAHVVKDEKKVKVALLDRCDEQGKPKVYRGTVIKRDKARDLALVRLEQPPAALKTVKLVGLDAVQVGARVFALGHPSGQSWTLTQGLVSQVRPNFQMNKGNDRVTVIQTDAAINPGNSGGPLFLPDGRQIGVNTFILKEREGLNYAVAANEAISFIGAETNEGSNSSNRMNREPVPADPPVDRTDPDLNKEKDCRDKSETVFKGRDEKLVGTVKVMIVGCSAKPNLRTLLPDKSSRPRVIDLDRNGDSLPDSQFVDIDRNGKIDISFHDNDFDKRFETMGRHPDGKVTPTTEEAIPPVLPLSKSMRNDPLFKSLNR